MTLERLRHAIVVLAAGGLLLVAACSQAADQPAQAAIAAATPAGQPEQSQPAEVLLAQGLTTIVVGADGGSRWPIAEYLADVDATQPALNVATTVGHGTVRRRVLGDDPSREATVEEIGAMKDLVRQAMDEGAFGLSSGLEYDPGRFAATEELIALAA